MSGGRIERGARAEVVDDAFERLNLRCQLTGGGAEVCVFDLEHRIRRPKLIDFCRRAPARAEADQNGDHHHAANGRDRRPQIYRQAAKHAARTVSHKYAITPRAHTLVIGSSLPTRKGLNGAGPVLGAQKLYHTGNDRPTEK